MNMNVEFRNIMATASNGTPITVENVSKTFAVGGGQSLRALDHITLRVDNGEFVAVVGPSGCGKSTLLRIIAGLELPDQDGGHAEIGGKPPNVVTGEHKVGVAFQDHALLPWLNVADNIMLPARLAGLPADRDQMTRLANLVGLGDFRKARPKELSGGMRQRVSIARAMMLDPAVLLFDEPFGALDLVTRRNLNLEMQRIWADLGTTTLLITHSVDEAVQLADRVVVMSARPGRIHGEIPVKLPRPRNRRVLSQKEFIDLVRRVSQCLDDASGMAKGDS